MDSVADSLLYAGTRLVRRPFAHRTSYYQTARIAQKLHRGGQIEDSDTA